MSRLVKFFSFLFLAANLWLAPMALRAQTVSGTILGLVQDQSGSAIPKADISARNLETGVVRKATGEENGTFRIASIPAGSYEISIIAAGFKTEVRSGIVVTVGGDVSLNFALTVGAVSEKVEVTAEASQVDTASSALGGFVNSATVRELPLNGRDWLQLALLQPGVTMNTGQATGDGARTQKGNGVAFSISGGRQSENAYRVDGLIVNDYANAGPGSALRVNMGVDSIREFSVLTNSYSAEYGRGAGGVINAITKSGTNEFHGSAYYFHRNSALDARNFFDGPTIPAFRRHQAGGALGGRIKRDKTFFFTNFETLHEIKGLSSNVDTISANARNGVLCSNPPACSTNTQVTVPQSVKPYLALFPLPNGAVTGNTGKFISGPPRLGEENYVIGKIDHYFSSTTTLSGSYTYDNSKVFTPDPYDVKITAAPARRQNVVLNLQHLFSPNLINNTRVGVSRTYAGDNIDSSTNPGLNNLALGFIPGQYLGTVFITGLNYSLNGLGATGINLFGYTAPQLYNDLSWTKGRHSIRTGFGFEREDSNINSSAAPAGTWTFGSVATLVQGTPNLFASDFPGADSIRGMRNSIFSGYVQDDFRILSNLTLNLGVRYEMATVIKEANGKLGNLRNITDTAATVGNPYWNNPTLKNFAPRIGFAWDPFKNGKTAVRGGFGMFDTLPLGYLLGGRIVRSPPFFLQGNLSNPPVSSFPNQIAPLLNLSTVGATLMDFNPSRSYRAQWNLNIQRQLTRSIALTVGYVGSAGVHLAHTNDDADQVPLSLVNFSTALDAFVFPIPAAGAKIQKINPNFGKVRTTYWNGHSSYNSLQVNLVQRFTKGLTYQLAYTWSKSMDDGSTTYTDGESANTAGQSYFFCQSCNRSVSDFDIPHNFVANFLYDVPVPAVVKSHALSNTILGGWQLGGIYTRQSGAPFSLKIATDRANTGSTAVGTANGAQKPMYVNAPGCSPNAVTGDINHYIMTQCFAWPAAGVLGNLGRNTLRMPTFNDLDFSVFKNQNLWGEKLKAQFRVEMFNVLNNTNLTASLLTIFDGSGNLTSGFGTPTGPTVNTSRQIQFGLRFLF